MTKLTKNQSGFGVVPLLLVLVIVGIIGFIGWYVWNNKNKLSNATVPTISSTTPTKKSTTKASTTTDPYAGWLSTTLKYEKISLKYPSSWKAVDTTSSVDTTSGQITPGEDSVKFISNDNLMIEIDTGDAGVDYGCNHKILSSVPLNMLGGTYYLNFTDECNQGGATPTNNTDGAGLFASASSTHPYPNSKNITVTRAGKAVGITNVVNLIVMAYYQPDINSPVVKYSVSQYQSDPNYQDALKILQSMHY